MSARTKIFNGKININLSGTIDPYAITADAKRINKYNGGLGRLTNLSASTGIQFSADDGEKKEEKNEQMSLGRYKNENHGKPCDLHPSYSPPISLECLLFMKHKHD